MKKRGLFLSLLCVAVLAVSMTGCAKDGPKITIDEAKMAPTNGKDGVTYSYSTYDNLDYNARERGYMTGTADRTDFGENSEPVGYDEAPALSGQYYDHGVGDPYILRYNGMYYFYSSTSTRNLDNFGVRAWKSIDLVHWEKCQGEGLPEGYVLDPEPRDSSVNPTNGTYAPEVFHFNGKFYMYTSQYTKAANGGEGHRVFVADDPEGPFELYSESKIDAKIDATVLIDDDETIYYLVANSGGIVIRTMEDDPSSEQYMRGFKDNMTLIGSSNLMGGWTEGPGLKKIRGQYYLTYTGCHVGTPGYQVCYAVADSLDKTSIQTVADSFRVGAKNPMLLNCDKDEGLVGLGHSSNVMGPDMDSYYISYHNLNNRSGPDRSLNIDRLLVYDGLMTTVHNPEESISPTMPRFYSYSSEEGFGSESGMLLSTASTNGRFTVEFNSRGDAEVKYILSYRSTDDYAYVTVDYAGKQIRLVQVSGGQETELATGTLKHEFSADDLHAVRVAYDDGKVWVYFDDMCKIAADVNLKGGKIGYMGSETLEVGYTAISDHANGSSDRAEIKQALGDTTAASYLEEGSVEGVGAYQLTGGSGMRETEGSESEYLGTSELYLENAYDYARYLVNFHDGGEYGMELVLNKKYCGKTICVQIDGGENQLLTIPDASAAEEDYVRVYLKKFSVSAGVRQVKIQNVGEAFAFVSFAFSKVDTSYEYTNSLSSGQVRGATFETEGFSVTQDGMYVSGEREFMYFGEQNVNDFEMTIDISLEENTSLLSSTSPIGVIFRQDNYAIDSPKKFSIAGDIEYHIQGYYMQVTKNAVKLYKNNFGNVKSYSLATSAVESVADTYYTYKISMIANTIRIERNEELIIEYTDPLAFNTGAIGLYATGGSGYYKDITIKSIAE